MAAVVPNPLINKTRGVNFISGFGIPAAIFVSSNMNNTNKKTSFVKVPISIYNIFPIYVIQLFILIYSGVRVALLVGCSLIAKKLIVPWRASPPDPPVIHPRTSAYMEYLLPMINNC